jgi:hypothetical protein
MSSSAQRPGVKLTGLSVSDAQVSFNAELNEAALCAAAEASDRERCSEFAALLASPVITRAFCTVSAVFQDR